MDSLKVHGLLNIACIASNKIRFSWGVVAPERTGNFAGL